ncbi:MAG: 4-hydroxybenzoate synthetase [Synechococcus sp. TMED19]|nr:MAG: 4-hydroxybenzoate synthetase [Synechococcus sp. TMED19]
MQASPRVLWSDPTLQGSLLQGPWQLMLLGDGSPTRHLQLLTGHAVVVEVAAMAADTGSDQHTPAEVQELQPPLLRRQVWLRCNGETLAWAESWWNQQQAEQHLQDRELPIWRSLTANRAELFREVDGLALVQAQWLQQRLQGQGPYWSRHYRFFRQGEPLTVIREVFSPALERWLGPTVDAENNELLLKVCGNAAIPG